MENEYVIGDKTYTNEELLEYGQNYHRTPYMWLRSISFVVAVILAYLAVGCLWAGIDLYTGYEPNASRPWGELSLIIGRDMIIVSIACFVLLALSIFLIVRSYVVFTKGNCVKRAIKHFEAVEAERVIVAESEKIEEKEEEIVDEDDVLILIKYKKLLDAGIINQEEFNAKKKELLK